MGLLQSGRDLSALSEQQSLQHFPDLPAHALIRHVLQQLRQLLAQFVDAPHELVRHVLIGADLFQILRIHRKPQLMQVNDIHDLRIGEHSGLVVKILQSLLVNGHPFPHQLTHQLHGSVIDWQGCHLHRFLGVSLHSHIFKKGTQGQAAAVIFYLKQYIPSHGERHILFQSGLQFKLAAAEIHQQFQFLSGLFQYLTGKDPAGSQRADLPSEQRRRRFPISGLRPLGILCILGVTRLFSCLKQIRDPHNIAAFL